MYGLALLNSDYEGNAITVRRASDNATTNIGFNGQDLDIAALESFCSGTDGFITTWHDQSGNANNAVQTTASSQPKIVSSGSVILENGKAAVQFDGVDDNIQASYTASQPLSIVALGNIDTARTFDYFLSLSGIFVLGSDGTPDWRLLAGNSLTNGNVTANQTLLFGIANGTNSLLSVNSSAVTGDAGTDAALGISIGARTIGGGELLGTVQNIVIYESDQSGNRTGIETALNDYYSIY